MSEVVDLCICQWSHLLSSCLLNSDCLEALCDLPSPVDMPQAWVSPKGTEEVRVVEQGVINISDKGS